MFMFNYLRLIHFIFHYCLLYWVIFRLTTKLFFLKYNRLIQAYNYVGYGENRPSSYVYEQLTVALCIASSSHRGLYNTTYIVVVWP